MKTIKKMRIRLSKSISNTFCRGKARLYQNKYAARYFTETGLRIRISLYIGLFINLFYALFKLFTGIFYSSIWLGAVAFYYILLSLTRFMLLLGERRTAEEKNPNRRLRQKLIIYRFSGYFLFVLDIAMISMVVQMIRHSNSTRYPVFIIFASAAFTFYRLVIATVQLSKFRKYSDPIYSAVKALNLSVALIALLSLQSAMLTRFDGSKALREAMNSATGSIVCLLITCMAIHIIIHSKKELKRLDITEH